MTVSAQMAAKLSEYRLQPGDVVLGRRGEMGRCAVISEREQGWLCGTGSLIVRPLQRALVPEYLQLLLTSRQVVDYLMAASVGSTMANLNQQHLLDMEVLLPPVAAQTRIVSKIEELLSDLDAGVAELKAAQKKLQQYRQSLLKAAVEGSLTAAWREAHPAPEETGADLLAHILRERRARWEAQQLAKFKAQGKAPPKGWQGKYPEPASTLTPPLSPLPGGWTWATVDQISAGRWYGTSAKTSGDSSGVPVLRMGNIQDGELDVQSLKYLPQDHDEFPNLLLTNGTMLFNRTNSPELVGKAAIYRSELSPCSFASYLIGVQFVSAVNPEFVAAYINSIFGRTWIKSVVTQQTGQANVNGSKLAALAVPLPPAAEQEQIAVLLTTQRAFAAERLKDVELSLRQSTAQRQNLLRAAFAGQLVPQDPADEPAAELLARIRAERSQVPSKLRKARSAAKESR
jgi:type I restriction enzyme S subunit